MLPKQFVVQELVPPEMFKRFIDLSIRYVDPRLLVVLGEIREWLDRPMTINNWHTGGNREWSGIRTPDSPYYSKYSGHSWGMAFDAVGDWDAGMVRKAITSGQLKLSYPVRLESGVSWLHVDVMAQSPVEVFSV